MCICYSKRQCVLVKLPEDGYALLLLLNKTFIESSKARSILKSLHGRTCKNWNATLSRPKGSDAYVVTWVVVTWVSVVAHPPSHMALLGYLVTARGLVAAGHVSSLDSRSWADPRRQEPVQQECWRLKTQPGFHYDFSQGAGRQPQNLHWCRLAIVAIASLCGPRL
jgi:hypothetical protein